MEKIDYSQQIEKLKSDFENSKYLIELKYALSIAKFKEGDVITNSYHTILVKEVRATLHNSKFPQPLYYGIQLDSKLNPIKNAPTVGLTQLNRVNLTKIR